VISNFVKYIFEICREKFSAVFHDLIIRDLYILGDFKMTQIEDYEIKTKITKLEKLNKAQECKIELEWLFEFSDELTCKECIPDGKLYTTHCIGTLKWNESLGYWQLIDITIIDCHSDSIGRIYDFGEIIDLEQDRIKVVKSSLRIVKEIGKEIQTCLDKYKNEPKAKDLNILGCYCIDDEYYNSEPMYF